MFRVRMFKKQSLLFGQYTYYKKNQHVGNFDVFFHDHAWPKIRNEVRYFRMRRFFPKRKLRKRFFKKKKRSKYYRQRYNPFNYIRYQLNKRKRVKKFGNYFRAVLYRQMRFYYYTLYRTMLKKFLSFYFKKRYYQIKLRLIPLPKKTMPMKLLMAFIMKKLFLKFTLFEAVRPFKYYFYARTTGFILRACGKLSRKQRAWYIKRRFAQTPNGTFSRRISYMYRDVTIKHGNVGVKLWLSYK